jgi:hypothetical protein
MARRQRPPSRSYPGWQSDDPLGLVQDELEDRPRSEALPPRPVRNRPGERPRPAVPPPGFPECPPERGERTWRLVRLFIETSEAYGRVRVVSPWRLGEELATKIKTDGPVSKFVAEYGADWAEDILARMIRIYWEHYVDDGMSRTAIVNQFLDDYWPDLFDQAKTQYATDEIQRLDAAGKLKTVPKTHWHSLAGDSDYQAALQDLRVMEKLRAEVDQLETEEDEPQS